MMMMTMMMMMGSEMSSFFGVGVPNFWLLNPTFRFLEALGMIVFWILLDSCSIYHGQLGLRFAMIITPHFGWILTAIDTQFDIHNPDSAWLLDHNLTLLMLHPNFSHLTDFILLGNVFFGPANIWWIATMSCVLSIFPYHWSCHLLTAKSSQILYEWAIFHSYVK